MTHNPNNLSDETVGVKDGWRLLDVDETPITNDEAWNIEHGKLLKWHPPGACWLLPWAGRTCDTTYRTCLTRTELQAARGVPQEQPTESNQFIDRAALLKKLTDHLDAYTFDHFVTDPETGVSEGGSACEEYRNYLEETIEAIELFPHTDPTESLRAEVARLEEAFKASQDNVKNWFESCASAGRQLTTALATVEELRKERDKSQQLAASYASLSEECGTEFEGVDYVTDVVATLKTERAELTQQLREAQAACATMKAALEDCELCLRFSQLPFNSADRAIKNAQAAYSTCGQPILNEIAQLKESANILSGTSKRFMLEAEGLSTELDALKVELDAVKKERDELRLETARIAQDAITAFSDKIRKAEYERDTALRSLATSEAATAVLREALYNAQPFVAKHGPSNVLRDVDAALSTTPTSDLLADKARLDVIDSEGIIIMSISATQFTVLTGDGESADGTTLRETIDKITAAKTP